MSKIKALLGGTRTRLAGDLTAYWEQGKVTVEFRNGRKQVVRYRSDGEFYSFRSIVIGAAVARDFSEERLAREILTRNRSVDVVGFVRTPDGKVEGRVDQREATLQREELLYYLATLAREADRFEQYLTGKDRN